MFPPGPVEWAEDMVLETRPPCEMCKPRVQEKEDAAQQCVTVDGGGSKSCCRSTVLALK